MATNDEKAAGAASILTPVDPKEGAMRIDDRPTYMNPVTETEDVAVIVMFRRWRGGHKDVIALFPEMPADYERRFCDSYMVMGGHSGANYHGVVRDTRPASIEDEDVQEIIEILQDRYGYRLIVRERWHPSVNPMMRLPQPACC